MTIKQAWSLTAVVVVALVGCTGQPAKPQRGEVDRLPHVETVNPEYMAREETVELLATVEALERARLSAQVQGEVKDLSAAIDIGRPIKKGEELITLDIPAIKAEQANKHALLAQAFNQLDQAKEAKKVAYQDAEEAKAQVNRYKADLEFRELALKRTRELVAKGTLQPQLMEEAELQRNSSRAALDAAQVSVRSKLAKLQAADVELRVAASRIKVAEADVMLVDTKVSFATIKAPFDGIITRRWVHNGDIIRDPTMPLLTVMRTDMVRVVVDIPERYVPYIRAIQSQSPTGEANWVRMRIQKYQGTKRLTLLASAVNDVTRLMRAEIHVPNDKERHLRPGMTGTATVVLNEARNKRLTVPSTALVRVGEEIRLYYLDQLSQDKPPRGKVKAAVVEIGLDDGKTVEIRKGLAGHELVIAKGNGVVREGEMAIPVPARERKHE
jgi:RND family efflux transporter MFP subunit